MEIRALTRADAEAFQTLRRQALEDSPRAFAESVAEHDAQPLESIAKRLAQSPDQFVIGCFHGEHLIGIAGLARHPRTKLRHKALIWGVFVAPTFRGQGVARAILAEIIRRAKTIDGLMQINLNVASGTSASRLYKSLGFEVYGHEPNSIHAADSFVDEDLMVLRLGQSGAGFQPAADF
jgi:RimJ/RimL family protein N-acetyltransferase